MKHKPLKHKPLGLSATEISTQLGGIQGACEITLTEKKVTGGEGETPLCMELTFENTRSQGASYRISLSLVDDFSEVLREPFFMGIVDENKKFPAGVGITSAGMVFDACVYESLRKVSLSAKGGELILLLRWKLRSGEETVILYPLRV